MCGGRGFVVLSAEGLSTNAIMRLTGKSKICVWRWQELSPPKASTVAVRQGGPRAFRTIPLSPSASWGIVTSSKGCGVLDDRVAHADEEDQLQRVSLPA
jgi:hypothetical protein